MISVSAGCGVNACFSLQTLGRIKGDVGYIGMELLVGLYILYPVDDPVCYLWNRYVEQRCRGRG